MWFNALITGRQWLCVGGGGSETFQRSRLDKEGGVFQHAVFDPEVTRVMGQGRWMASVNPCAIEGNPIS